MIPWAAPKHGNTGFSKVYRVSLDKTMTRYHLHLFAHCWRVLATNIPDFEFHLKLLDRNYTPEN